MRVAVVGAGWAGCAAAVRLTAGGAEVILLEATRDLGGRARRVELDLGSASHVVDNGQHLMIGAYTEVAALLRLIGVDVDSVLDRRPFELCYPDGFRLRAARLPAPWHLALALLTARGISLKDRFAMTALLRRLKRAGWKLDCDRDVAGWLAESGQERLIARVWRPLAVAALNTPIDRASAQIFANVLRDSLGAESSASEIWLARSDLSTLLPDAAARFVASRGHVHRGARVETIARTGAGFRVATREGSIDADAVVYAAPPAQLARAAAALPGLASVIASVSAFSYEPIATVYMKYADARTVRAALPRDFTALIETPERGGFGQWAFDRGAFEPANAGVVSVVVSASGPHTDVPLEQLAAGVARQVSEQLRLSVPIAARCIVEKRATLSAVPGLIRPPNATPEPGFVLAGDWTASDYPSTLETAARSGSAAARLLLESRAA
jgi:squalene-associated FAD-dependent desaturase